METVRTLSRRVDGVEYAVDRMIERLEIMSEEADERWQETDRRWQETRQESMERFVAFEERMDKREKESAEQFADFQKRMDEANREHRREQGRLSNKMGTLVEDLVAPSIPRILREIINSDEPPTMFSVRMVRRDGGRTQEYDVVVLSGDYLLINETKSNLNSEDIPKFLNVLRDARTFLPEYADKKIIGALATFHVDPSLVTKGEREGLIMLGAGEGIIKLLNQDQFVPRLY